MELTPEQRAAIERRVEEELASGQVESGDSKSSWTKRGVITACGFIAITVAAAYFIYPGPQHRAKAEQVEKARKEAEVRQRIAGKVAELEERKRRERELENATKEELTRLVDACRKAIVEKTSGGTYDVYFARYTWRELERLRDIAVAMNMPLGRPSVALDNYDFSPVDYNVKTLLDPRMRTYAKIEFVLERAVEAFSTQRFAEKWSCSVDGLTPQEPRPANKVFF